MFELLPESTGNTIGFRVSGKLTAADYDMLLPKLDEAIAAHGKINLLVLMEDFEGWDSLDAAKADFRLGTQQYRQVERAAFVGEGKWQRRLVKIMDPLTRHIEERAFERDQLHEAWQWVKGKAQKRVVVALGGNALLKRGEPMTADVQRRNVKVAAEALAPVAREHQLVLSHGNGPQVGLLALQGAAYQQVETYPLDVLGAQTEGMIGYMIEQELGNLLPFEVPFATILTMVEVDPEDPAFRDPTKFVGPVYDEAEAKKLAGEKDWVVKPDGKMWRRVVPSPLPKRIFEIRPIKWLLEKGTVVICAGGGGIPTMYDPEEERTLTGIEAVIDKDRATELLARELEADLYIMATDVDGVYLDWGTPQARKIDRATPDELEAYEFAAGSMGPKVEAACAFVRETGKLAAIGALADIEAIVQGTAGTIVEP
jgi:carbamate kinase